MNVTATQQHILSTLRGHTNTQQSKVHDYYSSSHINLPCYARKECRHRGRAEGSEPESWQGALFCQSVSGLRTGKIIYTFLFATLSSKSLWSWQRRKVGSEQHTALLTSGDALRSWHKEKKRQEYVLLGNVNNMVATSRVTMQQLR